MKLPVDYIPFVQRLVDRGGPVTCKDSDDMDDEIDLWHLGAAPAKCELHEWIGMTWDEYKRWVMIPSALVQIVEERRAAKESV